MLCVVMDVMFVILNVCKFVEVCVIFGVMFALMLTSRAFDLFEF